MRLSWRALILLCGGLVGCRTVSVPLSILKPAAVNMNPYQNVVIDRVDGEIGVSVADLIFNRLRDQGRFQLYEREALLTGHVPGGTALITGTAQAGYRERIDKNESTCYYKGQSYKCWNYIRYGDYSATGSMRVTDVASGKRAGQVNVGCSLSGRTEAQEATPPLINIDQLARGCAVDLADDFVSSLAPYRQSVTLHFRKNGSLPLLAEGIEKARTAELKAAIDLFQRSTDPNLNADPEERADAWWDLALAYEYDNQFALALEALKQARQLDPGEEKYQQEAVSVEQRQAELAALAEQGVQ